MVFRRRDPAKPRRELSAAQQAANDRSFRIFRLRGLWFQALLLTEPRRSAVQELIDAELCGMGAEPETPRQARLRAEVMASLAADRVARLTDDEIPF